MENTSTELSGAQAPVTDVHTVFAECITRADWAEMIAKQVEAARGGNKSAFELLLEYAFGRPTAAPAAVSDETPIHTIKVRPLANS